MISMIDILVAVFFGFCVWAPIGGLIGYFKGKIVLGILLGMVFGIFGVIGMCFIKKDTK